MRKKLLHIFFLAFPIFLFGQSDSIVLSADKLLLDDIQPSKIAETKQKIYAATRSLKDLDELPFTVYVITKEEIRNNNYRTLVDVLKMQPGIIISQPGSGLEGETFLMRGLLGNSHTKILLNGNPIKPSVTRGMPIGAQIPIQQAERIEIIYGAVGVLYGSDASAGLINIVLEETERPVYTQANLSLGSNEFTNLDISFGGRLGKRKNTLQYSLFGSYTFRGDLNILHNNDTLFNPDYYYSGTSTLDIRDLQNFVNDGQGQPIINTLPHQSRMVGVQLAYRAMKLSAEAMYRRDHSSLGMNPTAVSYTNPLNYIGERIINANFSLEKNYKRFGFEWRMNCLHYQMDSRSSYNYVINSSAALLENLTFQKALDINTGFDKPLYDSINNWNFQKYFDGTRFSFSESLDVGSNLMFNIFLAKNLDFQAGITYRASRQVPIVHYSKVPIGSTIFKNKEAPVDFNLVPFPTKDSPNYEANAFIQLHWQYKNWVLHTALQASRKEDVFTYFSFLGRVEDIKTSFDPRLAILYRFNNKFSMRAYYGTTFRFPPGFYRTNTFRISYDGQTNPIAVAPNSLEAENSRTYELGMRWASGKFINLDIVGFYDKTTNLIGYGFDIEQDSMSFASAYTQGFFNSSSSQMKLYGVQLNYFASSDLIDFGFNMVLSDGIEKQAGTSKREGVSEMPKMIRKTRIVIRPVKKISLTFDTIRSRGALNRIFSFDRGRLEKFRTIDILFNYNINRNFRVFFKSKNVFNKEYAGLYATSTIDDLIYNPQEKRTFRVGMSYRVD